MIPDGGAPAAEDEEISQLMLKGLREPLSPEEMQRYDRLVASSPERTAMAQEFVTAWTLAGLIDPAASARREVETGGGARTDRTRRGVIAGAVAAGVAASVGAWFATRPRTRVYQAGEGPLRATLADGSHVVLSRGGRLEVILGRRVRQARLLSGEAFYAIAKDPHRPFQVLVGATKLTVLGTRFNVDPRADGLRVDLLEGLLKVEPEDGPAIMLRPGEQFRQGRTPAVSPNDVQAAAAWIDGRLIFDDASLAELARSLHRQTGETLTFSTSRLERLRFSGVLGLQDDAWRIGLEAVLPVRVTAAQGGYLVSARTTLARP